LRASVLGTFQMVVGFASLSASFLAGWLWDKVYILMPFYFSLGLSLTATILMFFVKEKRTQISQRF